jgi:hypothetical protein
MQFDERKRKLIVSGAICSAKKKRFFPVNLLSPDSIQEGEEENISVVAQGIPLRIEYVERIAPGLTNR